MPRIVKARPHVDRGKHAFARPPPGSDHALSFNHYYAAIVVSMNKQSKYLHNLSGIGNRNIRHHLTQLCAYPCTLGQTLELGGILQEHCLCTLEHSVGLLCSHQEKNAYKLL